MTSSANKLVFLESLRGLAALMVVFTHLMVAFCPPLDPEIHPGFPLLPNGYPWAVNFLSIFISGGYAVRLFFFLSGFVLAISYFRTHETAVLTSAALRRYPRLMLPALASILFVWVLQEFHAYRNLDAAALMHQDNPSWLYYGLPHQNPSLVQALAQGMFGTFIYFDPETTLNGVLWTMPIELAGSFFVFSFLALLGSVQKRFLIYIISALLLHYTGKAYMLDFLCGIALSDLFVYLEKTGNDRQISTGGAALMLIAGCILGPLSVRYAYQQPPLSLPLGLASLLINLPTLASLLIVGSASFSKPIQCALEHSAISFLGRISFPLYLFHAPIFGTLGCGFYILLRNENLSPTPAALFTSLFVVTASVLVAWGAFHAIERPAIRAGGRIARFFHLPRPSSLAPEQSGTPKARHT